MRIKLFVEKENNVSGNRRHGTIYPMFSDWACTEKWEYTDSENGEVILYRKITIEDGTFSSAGKRHGYTGQHTNLGVCLKNGINENAPRYVYGEIFSRNKYGGRNAFFRLDLKNCTLQIKRGKCGKWHDFIPANYID